MSFGFITFNLSCLNNSKLINEKVYACDNSFKPSLSCFLEDHTLCPYLKWTIVKDAELITDENGNVIKCDKTVNEMINHLVAIEGYCFHDEDDNYKISNVPCHGLDKVSNDCFSKTNICQYFGWCHAKSLCIKTDLNGIVVNFTDNKDY